MKVDRSLLVERIARALLVFLPVTSLVALALLLCGGFTPQRALLVGGLLSWMLIIRLPLQNTDHPHWPRNAQVMLALLLVFAALLRWPPSLYVQGGQDQGVYVSMAAHFVDTRGLGIDDRLRESLNATDAIARYDRNNLTPTHYQPGAYVDPERPGHYIFQFYPIHPLWMGIFGGLLGVQEVAFSQFFFAMVTLLFAALLGERIARSWRAGVAYAALLALLPLHVYFSKFPISEMPALAFALMAWYATERYHDEAASQPNPFWLVAALLCFLALFLTRISGFVYLPVVFAGALISHAFVQDPRVRMQWGVFWIGVVACYAISVVYGLLYSNPYATAIYQAGLGERLYGALPWLLPVIATHAARPFVLTTSSWQRERLQNVLSICWQWFQRWGALVLLLIVALGAVRVGLLAFTDHYAEHRWYDVRWAASHTGVDALRRSSLWVLAAHLSPFVALLLPFAFRRPGASAPRALLVCMLLTMIAYTAFIQWFTPYQYYYARYLLSEAAPYALLLVVIRAEEWMRFRNARLALPAVALFTVTYFAWLTWPLVGFREADRAETSLARIADRLDGNDVLLFDDAVYPNPHELVTPLRFFFHKFVYEVPDIAEASAIVRDLVDSGAGDIYLIGRHGEHPPGFTFVDHVTYEQRLMRPELRVPRESAISSLQLSFFRLNADVWAAETLRSEEGLSPKYFASDCCTGIYSDDVWTDGNATIRRLNIPAGKWHTLLLRVQGNRTDYDRADIKVQANGRDLVHVATEGKEFTYDLGTVDGPSVIELRIASSTMVPRDLGINDDTRKLGIDIESIAIR
jgi:hypothetical protein